MKFFPLHVHSHYSLLDGLSKPKDIAKRCVELDLDGSALTDHGTVSGAVTFVNAMKNKGKKPILGCEFYICQEDPSEKSDRKTSHLVVLAKNAEGWRRLLEATSESNKPEFFYYKPRLNLDSLAKFVDGNLVAFSGHMGSDLANIIFANPSEAYNAHTYEEARAMVSTTWLTDAKELALKYQSVFGEGNFFIEIQLIDQDNLPASRVVAEALRFVSKETGISPVATPDAHYARPEDAHDQRVLLCTAMDTTLKQVKEKMERQEDVGLAAFFRSDNYHIPSLEAMQVMHTDEEINNTMVIADMCEEYDITNKPMLPKFPVPKKMSSEQYLYHLCQEGWTRRKEDINRAIRVSGHTKDEYGDRVKKELDILTEAGLSDYFLIVHDIIREAKERGEIVGAGRGSAAGSLVLYLLGVTEIDPIEYDLIFERFYNAGRNTKDHVSLPDVDMDFEIQNRDKTIAYIKEKYGHDKVAQILTFSRMQGRGALKDVLRVHSACGFEEMNRITKWIPDEADISDQLQEMREADKDSGGDGDASIIMWALENNSDELKQWCHIDDNGELQGSMSKRFEQAVRLEGTKRSQSKHAAGIVVSQQPLNEVAPLVFDKKSKEPVAGMEMGDLEAMGHVKFDILGIALLDKIHGVKRLVES
jgi:DNA polymerase-3 subunit alpha